jgi:hypothetical protein
MNKININLIIIMIIIAILIIIVLFFLFYNKNMANSVNNFIKEAPRKRYIDVVKEFGEPDYIVNKPGGIAIWNKRNFFEQIVLKDESIEHLVPKPHCDFLYASIRVYIPENIIPLIIPLSKSIYYDKLKSELTARCHFMGADVATLYLAMMIINDPMNAEMYYKLYGPTIMNSADPIHYQELYRQLEMLTKQNQKMYQDNMPNENCKMNI